MCNVTFEEKQGIFQLVSTGNVELAKLMLESRSDLREECKISSDRLFKIYNKEYIAIENQIDHNWRHEKVWSFEKGLRKALLREEYISIAMTHHEIYIIITSIESDI